MPWATTIDVLALTGITANAGQVAQAQAVIELFADVTEESVTLAPKNARLLKRAVAYQAAWMTDRPDVFTTLDIADAAQDGVSVKPAHANARILSPFAKRCIDRLSWKRTRSLRIGRRLEAGQIPRTMNTTSAVMDDNDPRWRPIGGGC